MLRSSIRILSLSVIVLGLLISCSKDSGDLFDPNSSEKSILEFTFPQLLLEAHIIEESRIIEFSVPARVDIYAMKPEIRVSKGATVEPASLQKVDLSQPFEYLVTAPNGTREQYTVRAKQFTDTAFLIIDIQNGWALDAYNCDSVFANINLVADRARDTDTPVIYVYDYSERNLNRFTPWEMEITDEVKPQMGDKVVGKRDVLDVLDSSTRLQKLLNDKEVGVVVLSGMTSGACVNSTCIGAITRGYGVIIAADCHSPGSGMLVNNIARFIDDMHKQWAGMGAVILNARDIYF